MSRFNAYLPDLSSALARHRTVPHSVPAMPRSRANKDRFATCCRKSRRTGPRPVSVAHAVVAGYPSPAHARRARQSMKVCQRCGYWLGMFTMPSHCPNCGRKVRGA